MTRQPSGFALLVVLWTLALLALFGTQIVASGRSDAQLARNLGTAAMLEAQTDGAVQETIFQLLQPAGQSWMADGRTHLIRRGRTVISIRVEDEGGKINPNIASEDLLRSLLLQVGAPAAAAGSIAAAIADWRTAGTEPRPLGAKAPQYAAAGRDYGPPGSDFRSIDELGAVLGMTPALLQRLRPHMTVYSDADPDRSTTDSVVAAALGDSAAPATGPAALELATVIARARGPENEPFNERVVVRLGGPIGEHVYDILDLQHPNDVSQEATR